MNGSVYLDLSTGPVYNYTITNCLKAIHFSSTKPLTISLMGKEFMISSKGSGTFTAFTGSISDQVNDVNPVTYGNYKVYITEAGSNYVVIRVTDLNDNDVEQITAIGTAPYSKDTTATDPLLTIQVLQVAYREDGSVVAAQVVVGPKGETSKIYNTGDYFPGTDLWKFKIDSNSTHLCWIALEYVPTNDTYKYFKIGEKLSAPNNFFEMGADHLTVDQFATITISTGSISVYSSPTSTSPISGLSARPAIILESDYPIFNNENSKKAYIVMNETPAVALAYWDDSVSKAIISGSAKNNINSTYKISFSGKYDTHTFTFEFYTWGSEGHPYNATVLKFTDGGSNNLYANYTWSSSNNAYILGATKNSAEAADISWEGRDGTWEHDAVSEYGTIVENIKSNAGSDKVVIKVPAEQQKAFVYIGKITTCLLYTSDAADE